MTDKANGHTLALGRYAALAFCRADILFEVSDDGRILFCSGPTSRFFGDEASKLVGTSILDFIHPEDQQIMRDTLAIRKSSARIDDLLVKARSAKGVETDIAISGYRVPDFDNNFFIAVKIAPKQTLALGKRPGDRDEDTGMLSQEAFVDTAAQRVAALEATGGKAKVSMVNIGDLAEAGIAEGSADESKVLRAIGEVLSSESLGGDTAGRLDDNNFSLVHDEDMSAEDLSVKIANALSSAAPGMSSLMPKIATMDASATGMDEKQLAKAMLFSLQEFTRNDGVLPEGDLADALQRGLERNVQAVDRFKSICENGSFDLVYMPVCTLDKERKLHHYEALTRFREEAGESPFQLITLAEEVGVIATFDLAVARRAMETIDRVIESGAKSTPVAINVSGHSISDPKFCASLRTLLMNRYGMENYLSLEITESAAIQDLEGVNAAIQEFRRQGYKVALDDFGAGAASFDYLNSFDVDTVKFDGPVVKRAVGTKKGKAFLASMATLCHEIDVETIAEMVEDGPLADFLGTCGIELGQGWYFGKPMPEDQAFPGLPPLKPAAAAAKPSEDDGMSLLERLRAGG